MLAEGGSLFSFGFFNFLFTLCLFMASPIICPITTPGHAFIHSSAVDILPSNMSVGVLYKSASVIRVFISGSNVPFS